MELQKLRQVLKAILTTRHSNRAIGRLHKLSHNTVERYRRLATTKLLTWSEIKDKDDDALLLALNTSAARLTTTDTPDWAYIYKQMQISGVTRYLLWEEYRKNGTGEEYSYSQFTCLYRHYLSKLGLVMRQVYRAGEFAFVDFAGRTIEWTDAKSGTKHRAQIFVGVLGCSLLTFAIAVPSQASESWILCNVKMLEYFGGAPEVIVCDNLKAAVIAPGREAVLNRTYQEFAYHYGTAIAPARIRKPKDKAKAENAVLLVERWIVAKLRNHQFFSVDEINVEIAKLLVEFNDRPLKKLPGSRRSRFMELEQGLLRELPEFPFEYAEWTPPLKVGPDYHVQLRNHYYSVHYTHAHDTVYGRITASTVEIFRNGKRLAIHPRSDELGGYTTADSHRPANHLQFTRQTPSRLLRWAETVGPETLAVVKHLFETREQPLLAMQASSQLQRLASEYGQERLEAACGQARLIRSVTLTSIKIALRRAASPQLELAIPLPTGTHENVRGSHYYSEQ